MSDGPRSNGSPRATRPAWLDLSITWRASAASHTRVPVVSEHMPGTPGSRIWIATGQVRDASSCRCPRTGMSGSDDLVKDMGQWRSWRGVDQDAIRRSRPRSCSERCWWAAGRRFGFRCGPSRCRRFGYLRQCWRAVPSRPPMVAHRPIEQSRRAADMGSVKRGGSATLDDALRFARCG